MKFKFCGDLDAPDWLLAEITVLSRITSVRFKLLAQQIIKYIADGTMDVRSLMIMIMTSSTTN